MPGLLAIAVALLMAYSDTQVRNTAETLPEKHRFHWGFFVCEIDASNPFRISNKMIHNSRYLL